MSGPDRSLPDLTPPSRRVGVWPWVVVALVWLALVPRALPDPSSDRGIFMSVAARLAGGDRLYSDVWDNKDPLFYYSLLPGRLLGPALDVLVELAWLGLASAAVFGLLLPSSSGRRGALLTGLGLTPLILTGNAYLPGFTELPGIAVCLASVSCLAARRPVLAGGFAGTLLYLKLIFLPVALLLAAGLFLLQRKRRDPARYLAGFAVSAGLVTLVLVLRGELVPYLHALAANLSYASGPLAQTSWPEAGHSDASGALIQTRWPAVGHLRRTLTRSLVLEVLTAGGIVAGTLVGTFLRRRPLTPLQAALIGLAALSAAGSLLVLAVTGLWEQHGQLLHIPAVLGASLLATWFGRGARAARSVGARPVVAAFLLALTLLLCRPLAVVESWQRLPEVWAEHDRQPPEAQQLRGLGAGGEYARLGQNDDDGHAAGLPASWELSCPRFHQYPFESEEVLDDVLDCAAEAPVVLVSGTLVPERGWPQWNQYVSEAEQLLAEEFDCRGASDVRVCTRR